MNLRRLARKVKNKLDLTMLQATAGDKEKFECPICGYVGPFMDLPAPTGYRKHAKCPKCHSLERHRTQYLVVTELFKKIDPKSLHMLHFAPETFFEGFFRKTVGKYETADLYLPGVDHVEDLTGLTFPDASFDFVYASHVLEHIADDVKAVSEIRRILKPGGIAIIPVPIVAEKTVEYSEPNEHEYGHMRAPGLDYFDKFDHLFSRIDRVISNTLPHKYQTMVYEDRSNWPTPESPNRPQMLGECHVDLVPICYV
jgi:SAM-dependent methyltransferase